jgi:hypothetical protein
MQMPLYVFLVLVSVAASLDPNIGQSCLKVLKRNNETYYFFANFIKFRSKQWIHCSFVYYCIYSLSYKTYTIYDRCSEMTEPVFVNIYGALESIPRHRLRQAM